MFAAVLDTCVLWPSLQRDFLLSLAVEGLYRPLWSSAILDELNEHEARKLVSRGAGFGAAAASATNLVTTMAKAFPDACVTGWEPLDGTYDLPDLDDEHLVAAAVVGGAGAIVTDNLRDLPQSKVPAFIEVITPARIVLETVELSPAAARRAVEQIAGRYSNPPRTVDAILNLLSRRYGLEDAVALVRAQL